MEADTARAIVDGLSHQIDKRRRQLAGMQSEIDSLCAARAVLLRDTQQGIDTAVDVRISMPPNQDNGHGIQPTKIMESATMLATHVRRSAPDQTISTKDAGTYLLEQGLTTEKSKRFQVWQILNAGGLFTRVTRGKYRLVDTEPDQSVGGTQELPLEQAQE